MRYVAWVDEKRCLDERCLDEECVAEGNSTWDGRVVYCSTGCFLADGHRHVYAGSGDDSHAEIGAHGVELEPDTCENCATCEDVVVVGIACGCSAACREEMGDR